MLLKKLLPLLLCTTIALCLGVLALPRAAYAAPATSVSIWGVELNAAYPYYVNGANGAQGTKSDTEPVSWNAHFDANTSTLTLKDLDVQGSTAEQQNNKNYYGIVISGDITLELIGASTVSTANSDTYFGAHALWIVGGDMTVTGDGSLEATGGDMSGNNAQSIGVSVDGSLTVLSGTLTGCGGAASAISTGVSVGPQPSFAVTVSDGALRGIAGNATSQGSNPDYCYGLDIISLTVSGGSVTGESGKGTTDSAGVRCSGTAQLSGGTIEATGGSSTNRNCYGWEGHLQYNSGTLVCRSGSAPTASAASATPTINATSYRWRTTDGGAYTASTTSPFPADGHSGPYAELTTNAALSFADDPAFNVPAGTVDTDIAAIDVSTGVAGGLTPYTFALESAPSWLSIDSGTGVITGTRPATAQAATTATVRVTDSTNPQETATIAIDIGAVTPALSAPAITDPVADKTVTVVSGSKAILSVVATSAVPLVYVWQVNIGNGWNDIPDATGASYTTAAVTSANNGSCYRCVVYNDAGNVTSPVFTVNVATSPAPTPSPDPTPSPVKAALPVTGDSAWPMLWAGLALAAGTGVIAASALRRKGSAGR